jgi:S-formylglutathione hydrolase FrmB
VAILRISSIVAALLAFAASAHADQRLLTIDTPSRYVDVKTAVFNGDPPKVLHANVLLPDGYDADKHKRWPVLYLLHGVGDNYSDWAKPAKGDIKNTAKGFPGIIVMPEGGKGFYSNWFNGGKRADPAWESYYENELIPQVARRFRIAKGRRNHAIAGLSMGGMGATYLGSQRPDYFGAVATFSGFVEHQRPTVSAGFGAVAGVNYEDIFGPMDGEYASGHNPTKLAFNLQNTPVFQAFGDGTPDPAMGGSGPAALVELEINQENLEFHDALERAGVKVDYQPQAGVHDWPYWRKHLRDAITWGLFNKPGVKQKPTMWNYKTIVTTGRMWNVRFTFAKPPEKVATFERFGPVLSGAGEGTVRLKDLISGCSRRLKLPFKVSKFFAPAKRPCR